ncbi:hypothetical protein [Bradyrhizobium yuanmingense]|uniref:hypothetical protein n=1 Tax=Bradyrhizobium yuanmingense TaxID=108015 RepID=UPI0023B8D0DC|nr:hypothetical protein [Bradyrhizobium yuanmingense]MDF0498413.1 hypothetical protein [Bradyrhizobium yuanmingense]
MALLISGLSQSSSGSESTSTRLREIRALTSTVKFSRNKQQNASWLFLLSRTNELNTPLGSHMVSSFLNQQGAIRLGKVQCALMYSTLFER